MKADLEKLRIELDAAVASGLTVASLPGTTAKSDMKAVHDLREKLEESIAEKAQLASLAHDLESKFERLYDDSEDLKMALQMKHNGNRSGAAYDDYVRFCNVAIALQPGPLNVWCRRLFGFHSISEWRYTFVNILSALVYSCFVPSKPCFLRSKGGNDD